MKILYLGCLGYDEDYNVGDWACYQATQHYLGVDCELTLDESAEVDAVILGGGTILRACSPSLKNELIKRPIFIVGSGIELYGYPDHPIHPNFHALLSQASLIGVRGPLTGEFLEMQAYKSKIIGDVAMCYDPELTPAIDSNIIGVNIGSTRNYLFGTETELLTKTQVLVKSLLEKGYEVKKFAMWPEDLELLNKIAGETVPFEKNIEHVCKFMKQCKLIIGEKLHTSIMAFACGVPFISLAYRHKCLDFMQSLGKPLALNYVQTDDPNMVDKTLFILDEMVAGRPRIINKISQVRGEYKKIQEEFFDLLKTQVSHL